MRVTLRPHQRRAVQGLGNGKILYGGVGVGKSITALAYYYERVCGGDLASIPSMQKPRDIYIITTAKKRDELDWQGDAVKLGLGIHDDSLDPVKFTVDSWNNLGKYKGVYGAFFIFDEQRLVGSGAWTKAFIHLARRNQWILLSATPGDTWLDYIPVFVANGFYKNRTEFKRRHVVYNTFSKFPKVDRYIETGTLIANRNRILVHMPYERHTRRVHEDVEVGFDKELFNKVKEQRWHVYEDRPLRDVAEMFSVMRKVANGDPSRLERVWGLAQKHPRLIVFYNFDYELEILRSLSSLLGSPTAKSQSTMLESPTDSHLWTPDGLSSSSKIDPSTTRRITEPWTKTKSKTELSRSSEPASLPFSSSRDASSWSTSISTTTSPSSSRSHKSSPIAGLNQTGSDAWAEKSPHDRQSISSGQESPGTGKSTSSETGRRKGGAGQNASTLTNFQMAEWNGHRHQPVPDGQNWIYLVQYQAGAEGWNCITTDAMVFYSLPYSYKLYEQAHGRIDRLNTPFTDLFYYRLVSRSFIDRAIAAALQKKMVFSESAFRAIWDVQPQ